MKNNQDMSSKERISGNGIITCPYCKESISGSVSVCPLCKEPLVKKNNDVEMSKKRNQVSHISTRKVSFQTYIFVILFLVAGAFYWFEIRPAQIRRKCTNQIYDALWEGLRYKNDYKFADAISDSDAETRYRICLRQNGLK